MPEPLRGLTRAEQVLAIVDVLLVLVLVVVLVVTLPGGGRSDSRAAAATPAATPAATSDAGDADPDASDGTVAFTLPSGNIACEMSAEGVLCTIGSFTYAAPQVTGCEAQTGHLVRLDADGFGFVCEDDEAPSVPTDGPELTYGAREDVGGYTCASGTDGVTCTDADGVGFRLARAQWDALP